MRSCICIKKQENPLILSENQGIFLSKESWSYAS